VRVVLPCFAQMSPGSTSTQLNLLTLLGSEQWLDHCPTILLAGDWTVHYNVK